MPAVFWPVASCSLVQVNRYFRGACCPHHQATVRTQPSASCSKCSAFSPVCANLTGVLDLQTPLRSKRGGHVGCVSVAFYVREQHFEASANSVNHFIISENKQRQESRATMKEPRHFTNYSECISTKLPSPHRR